MFEPVIASMLRETPAGESIKLNVVRGTGPIHTRLCTYDRTVWGGLKPVPNAEKDATEWPHDIVPAGTIVYPFVWNEAKENDGYAAYEMASGLRWVDKTNRPELWPGVHQQRGNWSKVI